MSRASDLTPAEFNVLKALWQLGKASVAEVRAELAARGTDVAYTTVMTLLGRLAQKGAVAVDREREPFVYKAAQRRESVLRDRLRDFVREVFDGQADALVMRLVEDESLSLTELETIQKQVETAERSSKPAAPAGPAGKDSKP
jgi:BlaI family transcriptional regulator, penicillinase repressor